VRRALASLYAAAIAAVDPRDVAAAALRRRKGRLVVRGRGGRVGLPLGHGLVVVGAGKGAAGLAAGVESVLGSDVLDGVVIVPPGYERALRRIEIAPGDHPVPGRRSRSATRRLLAALERHPGASSC
jgi:hydroxypyruvate reductase